MIRKLEGILRLAILGMSVYLVYTLYQPQADRLIREVKEQVFTTTEAPEALLTAEKEGQQKKQEAETEEAADFPERYDSRDYGKAPDVRNQGSLGTCWAVASVSALEASLLPEEHLRFSADHLSLQNGYAKSQDDGGAYTMTMAYLTSWKGPVLAEDDPYGDGYSPEGLSPVKHVQEIRILKDSTSIKEAVQAYGAVQTSLYMDVQKDYSSVYYNERTASYCYPKKEAPNHDILIIGWDDTYPASGFTYHVKGNGAYICQNSWGTSYGENGIFYVSYEDPNIAGYALAYSRVEAPDNYSSIYQSDLLGWVGQLGYGADSCYFANVYTSRGAEALKAVGFYSVGENTEYELAVVEDFKDTLSLAAFSPVQTGKLEHAGFYTVELDQPVALREGQRFAVVVKVRTPGENYPAATEYKADEYTETVDLSDGEGYISMKGYQWSRTETEYNCNVCLKAYTDTEG